MTRSNLVPRTSRRRWMALVPTAVAATALLTTGMGAPASASHPSADSNAAACVGGADARVKHNAHASDPNAVSKKEARKAQRKLLKRLDRLGYHNKKSIAKKHKTIEIPVRFHVILKDGGGGGVSTAQIKQQIRVMNQGFAGKTAGVAAKTPFHFFLKRVDRTKNTDWFNWADPDVDPADNAEAKAALGKNTQTDLNFYVANLEDGLLGYATFPSDYDYANSGVVVHSESLPGGDFAPYNEGDTATHEVGHWLGLYHTFQDGCTPPGDFVKDTPAQLDDVNIFGCNEADDTCSAPGKDPVHNFMSYGDDPCLDQFTKGQSNRMKSAWLAWRDPSLFS